MRDCRCLVWIADTVRSYRCVYCCRSGPCPRLLLLAQLQEDDQVRDDVERYHQCRYQAER